MLLAILGLLPSAAAHDARPVVITISEATTGVFVLKTSVPGSVSASNHPSVRLPPGCETVSPATLDAYNTAYRCVIGLSGLLELAYPQFNPSLSTMVRIKRASGEVQTLIAGPDELEIDIPDGESAGKVTAQYFALGVEHILRGHDHLLFLACLLVIARTVRRIVITVTGFTIAHSITLAAASLDLVHLPVPPVEAVIALSILFLAAEIARETRDTLTWRYPVTVSSAFGLLHGFGFASVLSEIGLPQTELPLALLMFNVGVEAGQLVFVVGLVGLGLFTRRSTRLANWSFIKDFAKGPAVIAYPVGAVAAFWLVERIWDFTA